MFSPFYNRIIRKMVVCFGSLFNNIILIRYNQEQNEEFERFQVPISYGPKEKYLTRLMSDPELTRSINTTLPRMSFEMVGLSYDSSRKQITTLKNKSVSAQNFYSKSQNVGVPYDFNFTLSVYVRNIEDGTQIVEQILPYFAPEYILTVNLVDGIEETTKDIPIILDSVDTSVEYEGDFSTTRLIVWTLNFTVKGYFFGPVQDSKIIMRRTDGEGNDTGIGGAIVNLITNQLSKDLQKVTVTSVSGTFRENEIIRTYNNNTIGTVVSWNPETNTLSVRDLTELLKIGDLLMGDYSNAKCTVSSLYDENFANVSSKITVIQDPITANGYGDFGFTTKIKEFPFT